MIYLLIVISLFLLELLYIRYAGPYILDLPNDRSSHNRPTVRGGGVIFYFAVLAFSILSGFQYAYFVVGLSIVTFASFWDDVKGLSRRLRLGAHLSGLVLIMMEVSVNLPWWGVVVFVVVAIGIVNAYNFMDGINGITAIYSLVVLSTLWYLDAYIIDYISGELMEYMIIAVLVFSFFNLRRKALCFAGDVGSVSMAFVLIFLLAKLILTTGNYAYILLLAVYGVDTVGTIIERLYKRENIFEPHRSHLYQLMANQGKMPHVLVSLIYGMTQLIFNSVLIYFISQGSFFPAIISLVVLALVFAFVKVKVFKVFTKMEAV